MKCPEELSLDEFIDTDWEWTKEFGEDDDRPNNDIAVSASEYARKFGGRVYTQADADGDTVYLLGRHFVNRTGIWCVAKLKHE